MARGSDLKYTFIGVLSTAEAGGPHIKADLQRVVYHPALGFHDVVFTAVERLSLACWRCAAFELSRLAVGGEMHWAVFRFGISRQCRRYTNCSWSGLLA